jgi:phosphate starvation-inducible PhoH-like protein
VYESLVSLEDINPLEFFGVNNEKFDLLKSAFPGLKFIARGSELRIIGPAEPLALASGVLQAVLREIGDRGGLDALRFNEILHEYQPTPTEMAQGPSDLPTPPPLPPDQAILVRGHNGVNVRARTAGQRAMVASLQENDILIAIGPAGSGKTYTAVALAVKALKEKQVRKIILCRPAVEAGERLGFLPGDLKEKIDPYLRPLYDALEDMLPPEKLLGYLERNVIEIAPLAYMRGRTLNHAFILLDEAQNATELQLKMFLTRMGQEAKIIITGDMTQIDLPRSQRSGLAHAVRILQDIKGIGIISLTERDVVRHPLVKKVIRAYEADDAAREARRQERNTAQRGGPIAGTVTAGDTPAQA